MTAAQSKFKVLMVTVAGAGILSLSAQPVLAGFDWTPPVKAEAPGQPGSAPATSAAPLADPNLLTPEPAEPAPVTPVEPQDLHTVDLVAAPADANELPLPTESKGPAMKTISNTAPVPVQEQSPAPQSEPAPVVEAKEAAPQAPASELRSPSYPPRQREGIDWSQPVEKEQAGVQPSARPSVAPANIHDATPVQGFGKDIPLVIALRQIAPASYAYKFDSGVAAGQKVSWQGGKPWPQVLSDMLAANNLQVVIVGNVITVQNVAQSTPMSPAAQEPSAAPASAPIEEAPAPQADADKVEVPVAYEPPAEPETKVARLSDLKKQEANDLPVPTSDVAADEPTPAQTAEEAEIKAANFNDEKPVAAVASKDAPVVDIQSKRRWQANPGKTLRETLESWSQSAGAEIEWMTPYDYPIEHAFVFEGRFDEAVDSLLSLYSREASRPRGRLYPNLPSGPSVLMIN